MTRDAHAYAAEVRSRPTVCTCPRCRYEDALPAVQNILAAHAEREAQAQRETDESLSEMIRRWQAA